MKDKKFKILVSYKSDIKNTLIQCQLNFIKTQKDKDPEKQPWENSAKQREKMK